MFGGDRLQEAARRLIGVQFMSDLKTRLAALLASPEGKAIVEEGMKFSTEEIAGGIRSSPGGSRR